MEAEPTKAYVYQPEPSNAGERIYGVAGPGSQCCEGRRFTKSEAQEIADGINNGKLSAAMLKAFGSTPEAKAAINYKGRS